MKQNDQRLIDNNSQRGHIGLRKWIKRCGHGCAALVVDKEANTFGNPKWN